MNCKEVINMIDSCAAIVIAAKHGELSKVKDASGITHTVGTLRCKFEFRTSDWNYTTRTAVFCKGNMATHPNIIDTPIGVLLDNVDECAVPPEVLLPDAKYFSVGVWGITKEGLRIVSKWIVFRIEDGCYVDSSESIMPTPSVYEQIVAELASKAPTQHKHDDEYYSKIYIDDKLKNIKEVDIPTKLSQLKNDKGFISTIPDEYITEEELSSKGYLTEHQSLEDYAKKTDIPDLSELKKDISDLDKTKLDKSSIGQAVDTALAQAKASGEFDGYTPQKGVDYFDGKDGYTPQKGNDYYTENEKEELVVEVAAQIDISGKADKEHVHDEYALSSDIPTNISELKNDSGYLTDYTETDPTVPEWAKHPTKPNYTADEVGALPDTTKIPTKVSELENDSGYLTDGDMPTKVSELENDLGYLTEHQDISGKADKEHIHDEYAKLAEVPSKVSDLENDSGYLTEHQDISGKADITYVDDVKTNLYTLLDYVYGEIIDTKADKTLITTSADTALSFEFSANYNTEIRTSGLTTLSFTFGNGEYQADYISGLSFDSGETPTAIDYTNSGILNWVGTDCATSDGLSIFQPSANTHYDIVFYFNGVQFIGLVNGFVPATGNEAV